MAFLFNRKLRGDDDEKNFQEVVADCKYTQMSQCKQLFIMERDFDDMMQSVCYNALNSERHDGTARIWE